MTLLSVHRRFWRAALLLALRDSVCVESIHVPRALGSAVEAAATLAPSRGELPTRPPLEPGLSALSDSELIAALHFGSAPQPLLPESLRLRPPGDKGASAASAIGRQTSGIYLARAAVLVAVALALAAGYAQVHERIAEVSGIKLPHVCCFVYASLSVSIDLSIKYAAEAHGGNYPFEPAVGVVVVEGCKLAVSAALFCVHVRRARASGEAIAWARWQDVAWMAIPAAIYAMNNVIVFQAIRSTPLATFGVVRETMLIWNALIWTATFRTSLSRTRWLAIAGIFLGCSLNQIPKVAHDDFSWGVLWALLLAFSNAAGGVATEYAMKQRAQVDINLQNAILYALCGSFALTGLLICQPKYMADPGIVFDGFVPECWQIIILQVITGLVISRILKYVESVTKTIVAAFRGPGVIIFGSLLFGIRLTHNEILATLVVCASCYLFLSQGPLSQQATLIEDSVKKSGKDKLPS